MNNSTIRSYFERYTYNLYIYGERTLSDVYKTPSSRKYAAFEHCKSLVREMNGNHLSIISYNCQFFTVGFVYVADGKPAFHVETASGTGDMILSANDLLDEHAYRTVASWLKQHSKV